MTIFGHFRLFESAKHWTSMSITYGKVSCDGKRKAGLALINKQQPEQSLKGKSTIEKSSDETDEHHSLALLSVSPIRHVFFVEAWF
jgi:hypothetical protein